MKAPHLIAGNAKAATVARVLNLDPAAVAKMQTLQANAERIGLPMTAEFCARIIRLAGEGDERAADLMQRLKVRR